MSIVTFNELLELISFFGRFVPWVKLNEMMAAQSDSNEKISAYRVVINIRAKNKYNKN